MQQKPTGLMGVAARIVSTLFARSQQNGARPLVEVALRPTASRGDIYGRGQGKTDPPRQESRWLSFDDVVAANELWAR